MSLIHISFSKIDFKCPFCNFQYADYDDEYLKKINKNKSYCSSKKCVSCKDKFYITYNYMGDIVAFKPKMK